MMKQIINIDGIDYILNSDQQLTVTNDLLNNIKDKIKQLNKISTNITTIATISTITDKNKSINTLAPSYTITKGSTQFININVSYPPLTISSPPYTYTIKMDDINKATDILMIGNTAKVPYTFNESIGDHKLEVYIKDSCVNVMQSNIDTSTITIICQIPICSYSMAI